MPVWKVVLAIALLLAPVLAADPVSDDTIYDQVRIKLAADRDIGGGKIDVKVSEGVVELTGKVKTERQKQKAEKIAKKVKGVQRVVNNLAIAPV